MVEDSPDPFKGLTQREQDIALLVSQGLSNKQIAERLYLSPKTVETHLTRAFAKLNVSARGDLKGAHRRRGLTPLRDACGPYQGYRGEN